MRLLPIIGLIFFILSFTVIPVMAAEDEDDSSYLKGIITGAFDEWIMKHADGLIKDSKLVKSGDEEARVGVFDFIKEPITILEDEKFKETQEESIPLFIVMAKDLVLIVTLLVLLQVLEPGMAGEVTAFFHGRATYYEPKDILKTGKNLALWFLCGPGILVLMFLLCNNWVGRMDTSALDQVVVSSDNLANYLVLGITSKCLKFYMAIRTTILMYASRYWYFIGLILAWKKTRWVGILFLEYVAVQVFVQPVLVSLTSETVGYTLDGGFGVFLIDMIVYGGLSSLMYMICFIAFTCPIWIKIFSPNTLRFIVQTARVI